MIQNVPGVNCDILQSEQCEENRNSPSANNVTEPTAITSAYGNLLLSDNIELSTGIMHDGRIFDKECYNSMCIDLLKFIKTDPEVADLKLSMYITACENLCFLQPFPSHLIPGDKQVFSVISNINEEIPSIELLILYLKNKKLSQRVVSLLHWLLIPQGETRIKYISATTLNEKLQKVGLALNFDEPSHVFKIMTSRLSRLVCNWKAVKAEERTTFSFHGGELYSMHTLLNTGFHPLLFSNDELYVTQDLKHCLDMIRGDGWTWGKSKLGVQMKAVLLVEHLEEATRLPNEQTIKALPPTEGSASDFVLSRPDLARIRYVLLYVQKESKQIIPTIHSTETARWKNSTKSMFILASIVILGAIYSSHIEKKSSILKPKEYLSSSSLPDPLVSTI